MKDKDKLNKRRHHRNEDGSKNRLRDNRHKHTSQLDKDRQISRDKRKEKRSILSDIIAAQLSSNSLQVLFILDETANNEKILVSRNNIKDDLYSLELPTFTSNELKEYIDLNVVPTNDDTESLGIDKPRDSVEFFQDVLKGYFESYYGITASEVFLIKNKDLVVVRGITRNESQFKNIVVRTYNDSTWFNCNVYVKFGSIPFYNKSETDTYLASTYDLGNVLVSGFLLYSVLNYREYVGKIETYRPYSGKSWSRGTMEYYLTYVNPDAMDKLSHEEDELKYLLFGKEDGKIFQDINKFVDFKDVHDQYAKKMADEMDSAQSQEEFIDFLAGKKGSLNEYNKVESEYFSRKKRRRKK